MSLRLTENINISFKQILLYIVLFSSILLLGKFIQDGIGIISFVVFGWLLMNKKFNTLTYFLIIWLYLNNYFIGQQYIINSKIYNYLFNGNLYTLLFFIYSFKKKWIYNSLNKQLFSWSISLIIFVFISNILHLLFKLSFLHSANVVLLFLIVQNIQTKKNFEKNILLILISIGFFEVIISYLQVTQVLPPPIKDMATMGGQNFLWIAGLDDIASGTFGAAASNVTSWFETVLFLFFFSIGLNKKSILIIILSLVFLTQYGSVDSKTALGVTFASLLFLFSLTRFRNIVNFRNIVSVILLISFTFLLSVMIKNYYNSNFTSGSQAVDVNISNTAQVIFDNVQDWGKFAGFRNITEDWFAHGDPFYLFIGYGQGNFNYDNNSGRIEQMDTLLMSMNNITRSRSSFIQMYGTFGIFGLLLLFWLFVILWKSIKKTKFKTTIGKSFKSSGIAFLFGSFLFMFLYGGHTYRDLAFQAFLILYAIVLRLEKKEFNKTIN